MKRLGLSVFVLMGVVALVLGGCGGGGSNCASGEGAALYLSAQPSTSLADGTSVINVSVSGQDNECNPLPVGTAVTFSLSGANPAGVGQFSNESDTVTKVMNAFGAQATLSSTVVGTVEVNATVDALSLVATPVSVTFDEPLPTGFCTLSLTAVPPQVIANGSTQTTITATLVGDDGQPIDDGTEVVFVTERGTFSNDGQSVTQQTSGGQAVARLRTVVVETDTEVSVSAAAICNDDAGTALNDDISVVFIAARPTVTVTSSAESLLGDGVETVEVSAQVHLNDGSTAGPDVLVSFETDLGNFAGSGTYNATTDADGIARATLTGGVVGGTATVRATVTIGGQGASGQLAVSVRGLQTVVVSSPDSSILADNSSTTLVTATVSLSDGTPAWEGMPVVFSTSLGNFSESAASTYSTVTDVSGRATATFSGGLNGGTAQITATATVGSNVVSSAELPMLVVGLDSVALSASASEVLADGVSTVDLRAVVTLSNGERAWQGMDVVFVTSTYGTFQGSGMTSFATTTDANGEALATFVAGTTGGDTVITATANVSTRTAADTSNLTLRALDGLNLICAKSAVLGDGVSPVVCTASAYLDNNTPVGLGTPVDFSIAPAGGMFLESGTTSYQGATNDMGRATASFVPGVSQSMVTITATATVEAQSVEDTWTIKVQELSSIQVDSIQYTKLGVRGSGRTETSRVTFLVNDANGDPLPAGCPVGFSLSTAPGQPSIEPLSSVTNEFGKAWTTVRSGIAATSVTVTARAYVPDPSDPINNPPVKEASATTSSIAIVGAKPNARYMTFACKAGDLNRAGFSCPFVNTECTVGLADRYTNQIGLQTNVNFYIEAGTINSNALTSEAAATMGQAKVNATTGNPIPQDVMPLAGEPSHEVGGRTANPRDGLVTIMATTTGEEEFTDLNANGEYDLGEPFIDLGEPFLDRNDNGVHESGEFYVDVNGDGLYTGPNGVWDSDTVIWIQTWMLWSKGVFGHEVDSFSVGLGANVDVYYRFWDENYNPINAEGGRLDASLVSEIGSLDKTLSAPSLARTIQDSLGIDIFTMRVKPNTTQPCCVEVGGSCTELDEVCHMATVIQGYSGGISGTARLVGEAVDTCEPPDAGAVVNFALGYKLCPSDPSNLYSYPFSSGGGFDGCVPDCAGKECGDDGCCGSCGTCTGSNTECVTFLCQCKTGYDDCDGDGACECNLATNSCVGGVCTPN